MTWPPPSEMRLAEQEVIWVTATKSGAYPATGGQSGKEMLNELLKIVESHFPTITNPRGIFEKT